MAKNEHKKSPIKGRILEYIEYKGISEYKLYKESGVTRGVLQQDTGISEENAAKFIAYAQDISAKWLFTGLGEMLNTPQKENFGANNIYGNNTGNVLSGSSNNVNYLPTPTSTINIEDKSVDKSDNPYFAEMELLKQVISQKDIIIEGKDILIAEKERLINILMKSTL